MMRVSRVATAAARAMLALTIALGALWHPCRAFALTEPMITEAQSAVICDQAGNVLWSHNGDDELAMASITKIMTAMVALDSGYPLDDPCTIWDVDLMWDAQRAGYAAGDTPTMRELLQALLVYSGNDAAINIAYNVSGDEASFVALMNQKAQQLGMTHTHFMNTHGLEEEGHYSSAADLVIMGRYALEHYPFIAQTVRLRGVELLIGGEYRYLESTDDLMESYEGLLGIKTGAVAAGTTFLGASARGNIALYTAVLGCATDEGRFLDTVLLMDWAYDTFSERTFGHGGWTVRIAPYALGFNARCRVTLPSNQTVTTWPEGSISYRNVTFSPDVMVEPTDAYSAVWWRQGGRLSGGSTTSVDGEMTQAPSVNILSLPLFEDMHE